MATLHHSWMLAHPRQAADMLRQLLDAELGRVLAYRKGSAPPVADGTDRVGDLRPAAMSAALDSGLCRARCKTSR
jgi:hypothetical protein